MGLRLSEFQVKTLQDWIDKAPHEVARFREPTMTAADEPMEPSAETQQRIAGRMAALTKWIAKVPFGNARSRKPTMVAPDEPMVPSVEQQQNMADLQVALKDWIDEDPDEAARFFHASEPQRNMAELKAALQDWSAKAPRDVARSRKPMMSSNEVEVFLGSVPDEARDDWRRA